MIEPLNIPFGLCKITYGGTVLPSIGSAGEFKAIPKYEVPTSGALNHKKHYILTEYNVIFEVSLENESYETLKLHMPTLQSHEYGLFDSPSNVNTTGKRLIIHPYTAGESKEFDLCIWDAYLDPETEFNRKYDKVTNKFNVRFIANRFENSVDTRLANSYFFIGDWSKVGVS
ncbi:hypothetical protein [Neobacillus mesonae]|uniref:hypothetical protein n=1 Tax=Neobacillus mesonae TaxID=1193713 RepID=UPI002573557D|nr:hypothetical protein [Neobacillus mesonae]